MKNAFDILDSDKNWIISKENIIEVLKIKKLYDNNKLAMNLISIRWTLLYTNKRSINEMNNSSVFNRNNSQDLNYFMGNQQRAS